MNVTTPKVRASYDYSQKAGRVRALRLFHLAAKLIPAYKDFLQRNRVDPNKIQSYTDFKEVPYTDKKNYITQYPISDLTWRGDIGNLNYIVSSSGTSGTPFLWPRGDWQDAISARVYMDVFDQLFGLDTTPTLIVNSYGQGSWIAGTELYNSVRIMGMTFDKLAAINTGIEAELIAQQLQTLKKFYPKIVICGYPPFIKDLIEMGSTTGLDWRKLDLYILTAGEAISEPWRNYILELISRPGQVHRVANVLGLADAGVIASESKNTQALAKAFVGKGVNWPDWMGGDKTIGLHQFRPDLRFIESDTENSLILSTYAGVPLLRYDTKDHGLIVSSSQLNRALPASINNLLDKSDSRNYLCLFGRQDYSVTFYAVNIYPENLRAILDGLTAKFGLTGRFVMQVNLSSKMDQIFALMIELKPNRHLSAGQKDQLNEIIPSRLRSLNSEYNELSKKVGSAALPQLTYKAFGTVGYITGKKHKWAKKD